MLLKGMKSDIYLKKFINHSKKKFKENLIAIVIYGSYPWKYFDKTKSDYDIFAIFKNKPLRNRKEINKKFPKISLQYFCTEKELIEKIKKGHFSIYVTLLKSAKVLYKTKEYSKFLKELKTIKFSKKKFIKKTIDKTDFELKVLRNNNGYVGAKCIFPSIRKRLQLLTYVEKNKLIWDLKKVSKKFLDKNERNFVLKLDKKIKNRSNKFDKKDKIEVVRILNKLNKKLVN